MNTARPVPPRPTNGQHPPHAPAPPGQVEAMNAAGRRIQDITAKIEALPDPALRALFQECMGAVLDFYGQGLERVLELAESMPDDLHARLVNDSIVRGLLLIHGLHPLDLETRLQQALDKVRPYMESHGGAVELLSLESDFARLRLEGACKTCASSAATMELAVRQAIEEICPDLAGFEVEGMAALEAAPASHVPSGWVPLPGAEEIAEGGHRSMHAEGVALLLCKVGGRLYAYRDRCPACNMPLHLGTLQDGLLSCRAGHRFDVRAAGRSPDDPHSHLEPLPLLEEESGGTVKVARVAP